jgi:multiple sugar transport system substrate-binding protein/arabinogalactan oligomer/maltooligosaccharide transport system substrate-binding protein
VATRALYVNTGLLAEAGVDTAQEFTTWDQVLDAAEAVNLKFSQGNPARYGFGANGPDQHRLYKKIIPFFWSNGGDILNEKGQPVVNSAQNIEALETYLTLARNGRIETQRNLDPMFMQGNVAFWISGSWLVDRIAKDNPSLKYKVILLPGFEGKPSVSFGGGEYLAINKNSKNQAAAKKLIAFLTSPAQALAFSTQLPGGNVPADFSVANDPALQKGRQSVFMKQMAGARMTPVHPSWLKIEEIIEDEVSQALLGQKEAAQALNDAQYRIVGAMKGESGGKEATEPS